MRFGWPGEPALVDGFDLEARAGRITALVGPSGCGKSTLLRLAAGLQRPQGGAVESRGERAFVFQAPTLLPWRTVAENVALPLELAGVESPQRVERVNRALDEVGLGDAVDKLPHELSGGMQMRCSLARALVTRPALLLLDEPFRGLDALTRRRAHALFLSVWAGTSCTTLLVTHDIDEAVLLADRVVVVGGRPLGVLGAVDVDLPRPRSPESRRHPAFDSFVRQTETLLGEDP